MTADIITFMPKEIPACFKDEPKLGEDSPIMDQSPYRDPPLAEYLASAGYDLGPPGDKAKAGSLPHRIG